VPYLMFLDDNLGCVSIALVDFPSSVDSVADLFLLKHQRFQGLVLQYFF